MGGATWVSYLGGKPPWDSFVAWLESVAVVVVAGAAVAGSYQP